MLKKELHLYHQINIYIIKNITTYSSTLPHQYQLLIIQTKNVPQNYEIYLDLMVLHSIELLLKRLQQQLFVMMDIEGKELFLYNGVNPASNATGNFSDGGGLVVDNKSSLIDIVQACGRALRKPNADIHKTAFFLIPILIPDKIEGSEIVNLDAFETVFNVIQSLRDQDNRLAEWINELNQLKAL